ncbi:MAG: hypothetical protein MUQ65_06590, partial [Armatimonadetes bacterium]|nr:hypothetical protein [Armatimonadota bacterium]
PLTSMPMTRHKWHLPRDFGCIALVIGVLGIPAIVILLFVARAAPLDGPFTGKLVPAPGGAASSSLTNGPFVFQCYNRPEGPPIILVRRSTGELTGAWELTLTRDPTQDSAQVASCTIEKASRKRRGGYTLVGSVDWTYGREMAFFHFDANGKLENFYLDW